MVVTKSFGSFDNGGRWREVIQVWARIPATGVWVIVSAREVDVDPDAVPVRPTRPV